MQVAFFICFAAVAIACCAAVIAANEARRDRDTRSCKTSAVLSGSLAVATIMLFYVGAANAYFGKDLSDHPGFGPGWHCVTGLPRVGANACVREIPAAP